jgi:GGDEF domain-containing protein
VANCAVVFALLVGYGRPGLGIGQGFYLSVVLAALATGPAWGAAAGASALVLYVAALLGAGSLNWDGVLSWPNAIRLASYVAAGTAVGYIARRGRRLLTDSLEVLDNVLTLAGRDLTTAALASHGLELAIDRRVAAREPFALLVGNVVERQQHTVLGHRSDDEDVRRVTSLIQAELEQGAELARIGPARFAIIAPAKSGERVDSYEATLRAADCAATFGWAVYPNEGADAFSLFAAALERLYARLLARGEWEPATG